MKSWKARLLALLAAVAMLLAVSAPAVMADDFDPEFAFIDGNDVVVCWEQGGGFGDVSDFGDGFGSNDFVGDGFGSNDFGDEEVLECEDVDLISEFDEFAQEID
jgi:hypothetical protein